MKLGTEIQNALRNNPEAPIVIDDTTLPNSYYAITEIAGKKLLLPNSSMNYGKELRVMSGLGRLYEFNEGGAGAVKKIIKPAIVSVSNGVVTVLEKGILQF